jgi:hypothetical protein
MIWGEYDENEDSDETIAVIRPFRHILWFHRPVPVVPRQCPFVAWEEED